jgi:hypothetical protein
MATDNSAALRVDEEPAGPPGTVLPEPEPAAPVWGPLKKILFRFAFVYLFLYNFPFPLEYIPFDWATTLYEGYARLWGSAALWVGPHLLHVAIPPAVSGDSVYGYVELFCRFVFSVVVALLWTLLDRRRRNYVRLYEWLRVYVRFTLAATMMSYGSEKIIPDQFPVPPLGRLMQPYGDASRMGLLWTFMGASKSYTIFAGATEMLGGLLLLSRRTLLLGALVTVAAMTNVVMLNFSYDVSVKLYSSHLLLMAIFLVLPDLRRLADLFLLNRPMEPVEIRPLFARKRFHRGALVFRTVFSLYLLGFTMWSSYTTYELYSPRGDKGPDKGPLPGLWNVEEFMLDGQPHPPLVTDETRWRRVSSDYNGALSIQLMNDSRERYSFEPDPETGTLTFNKRGQPGHKTSVTIRHPQPDIAILEGVFDGHKVQAKLRRTKPPEFLLLNRGFHWINEYPFNR